MTKGLITRIGEWMDRKWEPKATQRELFERWNNLENAQIKDVCELRDQIEAIKKAYASDLLNKEMADLKTRIEKIELYSGMTRKVDPTRPPVAKSAFAM